jgi:hypothetical protein
MDKIQIKIFKKINARQSVNICRQVTLATADEKALDHFLAGFL